jgi:hypothetical protein
VTGRLFLSKDHPIKFHAENGWKNFTLDQIRAIRFSVEKEELVQDWRFPEAGKTKKEIWGDPYPIRYFKTELELVSGDRVSGHLYTTMLYVETEQGTRKLLLDAKQRGDKGMTLNELIYPETLLFDRDGASASFKRSVKIDSPPIGNNSTVRALQFSSLLPLAVTPEENGSFNVEVMDGEKMILGVRNGMDIFVGWPPGEDPELTASITAALKNVNDFYESRELIGAFRGEDSNVYALVRLSRKGEMVGSAKDNGYPWQVAVWEWKMDEVAGRLMLHRRGYFFRDKNREKTVPTVTPSETLWKLGEP